VHERAHAVSIHYDACVCVCVCTRARARRAIEPMSVRGRSGLLTRELYRDRGKEFQEGSKVTPAIAADYEQTPRLASS